VEESQRFQVFCVSEAGDSRVLGLFSILVVSLCGLAAVPVWSVPIAAIALASISCARHHALFRRAADLELQGAIDQTLFGSLFNGFAASAVAYGCGAALRFLSLS
jgi:hypothetical protein